MTIEKKIVTGFIVCALILFGVAVFSFKNSEKFIASNDWVNHTNQVVYEFEQLLVTTINAETGERGYVITGDGSSLEPFTNANAKAAEHLGKLKELTKDNPIQQKNIEELEKEVKIRFDNCKKCIALRKNEFERAREFVASGEGKL